MEESRAHRRAPGRVPWWTGAGIRLRMALRFPVQSPTWAATVALAIALLIAAHVTPPLVTDAAADRTFATEATSPDAPAGEGLDAHAVVTGLVDRDPLDRLTGFLDDLPEWGTPAISVSPLLPYTDYRDPRPVIRVPGGAAATALVYAHDDADTTLTAAPQTAASTAASDDDSTAAADGGARTVWVPDTIAAELDLHVGDDVELALLFPVVPGGPPAPDPVPVRVAGIYLTRDGLPVSGVVDWPARSASVPSDLVVAMRPAALLITDPATALALVGDMGDRAFVTWDLPWEAPVTLEQGRIAASAATTLNRRLHDARSLAGRITDLARVEPVTLTTGVAGFVERAEGAATELAPLVSSIALAAEIICAAVLAVVLWLLVRARRIEHEASLRLGMHPLRLGVAATTDLLAPLIVGCAAAYLVVRWAPNLLAGEGEIDRRTVAHAAAALVRSIPVGVALVVVASTAAIWRLEPASAGGGRYGGSFVRWETIVVVGAVGTGAQLLTQHGSALDSGSALLFPLLALLAVGAVVVRVVAAVIGRMGRRRSSERAAPPRWLAFWLARRRFIAALGEASALLVIVAAGAGLFVYSFSIADAGAHSVLDKAAALGASSAVGGIGQADRVPIGPDGFPADLPAGWTVVWRLTDTQIAPGVVADLLVVDPDRFADAATWRASFSQAPLPDLMHALGGSQPHTVNMIVAGNYDDTFPTDGTMEFSGIYVDFHVVARIAAAPGQRERSSVVIVDERTLAPLIPAQDGSYPGPMDTTGLDRQFRTQVWSSGTQADLVERLSDGGIGVNLDNVTTVPMEERRPAFVAFRLSLPFLRVIGAAMLIVALASVLVHGVRRRNELAVDLAMTGAMGVRRRATAFAVAVEAALLGGAAMVIGTPITRLLVGFMITRLDPAPSFAPGFTGGLSWPAVGAAAAAVLLVSVIGALFGLRSARRMPIVEVLRGAA